MVVQHVIQHQLKKDIMKHGEHYVSQQKLDTHLLDGRTDQLQLQIHQRQQQISQ